MIQAALSRSTPEAVQRGSARPPAYTACSRCPWTTPPDQAPITALQTHWQRGHGGIPQAREIPFYIVAGKKKVGRVWDE